MTAQETNTALKNTALILVGIAIVVLVVYLVQPGDRSNTIILATTTSTYDSGLLDEILPAFTEEYGISVNIISVGTGQAIAIAEQGDADVLLVHAPASELQFMDEGYGIKRECVMYNDFIILGPVEDPAGVKGMNVGDALRAISEKEETFISRGDDSGTHKKELQLWKAINIKPTGRWYQEIGQGMGDTILMANEQEAYTMADRGTYLALKDSIELAVLVEGDTELVNQYGIITVKSSKKEKEAETFLEWMMSEETQKAIESFKKNGEQLFYPLKGECVLG